MAGYSDTPLWRKLGYKTGLTSYVDDAPSQYLSMLSFPDDVEIAWLTSPESDMKFVHLFAVDASGLRKKLRLYRRKIAPDGVIWVSWPKKSSSVATGINENMIREAALPIRLVDTKVCAVDEVWSGLKLMIRKEQR